MTMPGSVAGGGPTDISSQPQPILLQANVPTQVPIKSGGITLVNQGSTAVQLCSDQNFTVPVLLGPGVSMPWTTGTTVWALSSSNSDLLVLPEAYNYYNPAVATSAANPEALIEPFTATNLAVNVPFTVPLNSDTRTIAVDIQTLTPVNLTLSVLGFNSAQDYLTSSGWYLRTVGGYIKYIKVDPTVDSSVTVTLIPSAATTWTTTIYGDTDSYDDSRFFTNGGVLNPVTTNAVSTMFTGPCRLLSLAIVGAPAAINLLGSLWLFSNAANLLASWSGDLAIPLGVTITTSGTSLVAYGLSTYP